MDTNGTSDTTSAFAIATSETSTIIALNVSNHRDNFLSPEAFYKIGAFLAILGNLVIAVSLNLQKFAHRKRESQPDSSRNDGCCAPGSYMRSGTWWIGILLMAIGETSNFVSYGFAPASVVAPLGCVAVLANGVLAVVFNNEVLRMQDIMGAAFAVIGGFFVIQFSKQSATIMTASEIVKHIGGWQFIIYLFVEVIVFGLIIFHRHFDGRDNQGVILHLTMVAITGSFTVISAKAVSGMLTLTVGGESQLTYPILYVMLVIMVGTIFLQVKYLNEALARFDIAVVVPVNYVLFTASAILAGALFYQEFSDQLGIAIFMFFFGCMLSFGGVVFLTTGKNELVSEPTSLHMDMMPNFIRSLAPSFKILNVQPRADPAQVSSYPEDSSSQSLSNEPTESSSLIDHSRSNDSDVATTSRRVHFDEETNRVYDASAAELDGNSSLNSG